MATGQTGAAMLADFPGEEDPQMEHLLDMQAVATHEASWDRASSRSC